MKLDPVLSKPERFGSLVMGLAAIGYAVLGGIDALWLRAVLIALGIVFVVGGIGGT